VETDRVLGESASNGAMDVKMCTIIAQKGGFGASSDAVRDESMPLVAGLRHWLRTWTCPFEVVIRAPLPHRFRTFPCQTKAHPHGPR
jgi:hypothetical protein